MFAGNNSRRPLVLYPGAFKFKRVFSVNTLEEGNPKELSPLSFPAFYRIPLTPPFPAFAGDSLWREFEGKIQKAWCLDFSATRPIAFLAIKHFPFPSQPNSG